MIISRIEEWVENLVFDPATAISGLSYCQARAVYPAVLILIVQAKGCNLIMDSEPTPHLSHLTHLTQLSDPDKTRCK